MKVWVILGIVGMLAITSFAIVNALSAEEPVAVSSDNSYSCGEPGCTGGCSAGNSCGNPSCGFETTGSCGCRGP